MSRLRAENFEVALVDNYPSLRCNYLIAHALNIPIVAVGEATSAWEMRAPALAAAFDVLQGPTSPLISGAPLSIDENMEPSLVQHAPEQPQGPSSFLSRLGSLVNHISFEWILRAHLPPLPPDFQALTNVTQSEFALIGQTPELHLSLYDSLMMGVHLPQMPHVRFIGGITGS